MSNDTGSFEERVNNFVIDLYKIGGLKFGDFKMKVGINSPVYLDLRVLASHPKILETLALLLWEFAGPLVERDHICGVPYNALPIATIIAAKHNIPMLIRRKEAKNYGTKKLIEGQFTEGQTCVIIEDVVTSGSSILETVHDLENEGLKVTAAVVIVDRGQGGKKNLADQGLTVHNLLTLSKILHILCEKGYVDETMVKKTEDYLKKSQIAMPKPKVAPAKVNRLKLTYGERSEMAVNPVGKALFQLMEEKKTNLCVAVDVTTAEELLRIAAETGPYICLFKTHVDAVENFTESTAKSLLEIAQKEKFIIMEDRKFADIGKTVSLQYGGGPMKIVTWADLVTCHSISGENAIIGLKSASKDLPRGCFLVAEMSSEGNLITPSYTKATLEMAEMHPEFVVGLVTQSIMKETSCGLIQLTPGVRISSGSANGIYSTDGLGQRWSSPEDAVLSRGADIVVVGRGITEARYVKEAALLYQTKLWSAYVSRVG